MCCLLCFILGFIIGVGICMIYYEAKKFLEIFNNDVK